MYPRFIGHEQVLSAAVIMVDYTEPYDIITVENIIKTAISDDEHIDLQTLRFSSASSHYTTNIASKDPFEFETDVIFETYYSEQLKPEEINKEGFVLYFHAFIKRKTR